MKSIAAFSFQRDRSAFFRDLGKALSIASRTIRRCTPSFFATPAIVPTPNSYSRRICFEQLHFASPVQGAPLLRASPESEYPFVFSGGPKQLPNWATTSKYR